ncbi:MAG: hypothetical protein Q9228_001434 [Teloschistes exilis]
MKPAIANKVSTWLFGSFCEDKDLKRGNLPKHTVGYDGVLGALCYHWTLDEDQFFFERDRIQLALFILLLAYTGQRPGAIVESDAKGNRNTNEALKYKDIKLKLVRGKGGEAPLLVMTVDICLDKGKRGRGLVKTFTLFENCCQPVMCPIVYFLALAFTDNIFHPKLVEAGISAHRLHSFTCPTGRSTIDFSFRKDVLETPIFRPSKQVFFGKESDTSRALTAAPMRDWMIRLGDRVGFTQKFKPYCLRRDIATSLADSGTSQPQLLQILGHAKIETFINHYQSSSIVVDVQSTFLGDQSKSAMIKQIGRLCQRLDPNMPRRLTEEQVRDAYRQPKFRQILHDMERRRHSLRLDLVKLHGRVTAGLKTDKGQEYSKVGSRLRYCRRRATKEYLRKILEKYHDTADLDAMVLQLQDKENFITEMLPEPQFVLEERRRLATLLFQPTTETSFAQIVEDLSSLCMRRERIPGPGRHPTSDEISEARDSSEGVTRTGKGRQIRGHTKCLFCFNNGRTKSFSTPSNLRTHYKSFHFQHQVDPFKCPVPGCSKLLIDSEEFTEHANAMHQNCIKAKANLKPLQDKHFEDLRKTGELVPVPLSYRTVLDHLGNIIIVPPLGSAPPSP